MAIVDLFFPKKCLNCGKEGTYICSACIGKLSGLKQICLECTRPSVDGMTHVRCKRPWGLDGLVFLWPYQGVVRQAILKLKYKFALEVARELAGHVVNNLKERKVALPLDSVFVSIPLYWYRKNWRGFNQVEEVGKLVAKSMNWDFQPDLLVRKRLKRPQTDLKKEERTENVRGVFALNPKLSNVRGYRSIVLFDDVLTTGATIKEAAKVLKRSGAKSVWGLTIAR
ncbi:ComF family protein [Patescibacteria group bacterium]|nr:ComF family protein [Patescibacteria group bacterium]